MKTLKLKSEDGKTTRWINVDMIVRIEQAEASTGKLKTYIFLKDGALISTDIEPHRLDQHLIALL